MLYVCKMKYTKWRGQPTRFLAMTGYNLEQFDVLLPYFEEAHDQYLSKYEITGKPRKGLRKFVLYANSPLNTIEERLVFILSYLKLNPLQEQHADLFDMQQKQCNQYIHGLKTILDHALEAAQAMPSTKQQGFEQRLESLPKEKTKHLFQDGTERTIPRPLDPDDQQSCYSGKKKRHTLKNTVITISCCFVLFTSPTVEGKVHDKKIADTYYSIPKGHCLWQDTGYQGYQPEGVVVLQPTKKPKGKSLTGRQQAQNRLISKVRVRVEHAIGSIKRMRIVKDTCRLRKEDACQSVFKTCVGLHNLRIKIKPFNYKIKLT